MSTTAQTLAGGFADAPVDAAHAFRGIMTAMARPGHITVLTGVAPPQPLSVAAGAVLVTLCDPDTGVYLAGAADCALVRDWLRFHTSAPLVGPKEADFALGCWADLMPLDAYRIGNSQYPDQSATLVVEMETLIPDGAVLRGPGIQDTAELSLSAMVPLQNNAALYPLGVDLILTCGNRVAALPRSTQISEG